MTSYEETKRKLAKTDRWLYVYCPRMGWHRGFKRRVWCDEEGTEYVDMRGWTLAEWVKDTADWWQVERDY